MLLYFSILIFLSVGVNASEFPNKEICLKYNDTEHCISINYAKFFNDLKTNSKDLTQSFIDLFKGICKRSLEIENIILTKKFINTIRIIVILLITFIFTFILIRVIRRILNFCIIMGVYLSIGLLIGSSLYYILEV